ncbi:hypothetical protein FB451DRAFT_1560426 [Mycena latifolia]|nr:hypothetical protein FB451DRAFT_1560426 [Mycena latifolia]
MSDQLNRKYKQHLLRAISLPSFSFSLEALDSYWRTRATSGMSRELLEFTGDGYLIRCVLRMLAWGDRASFGLELYFCSILVRTGMIKSAIMTSAALKCAAETFEAYVGAYFRQRGEEQLNRWICANFGPLAESLVPTCYDEYRCYNTIERPAKSPRADKEAEVPRVKRKNILADRTNTLRPPTSRSSTSSRSSFWTHSSCW